MAPKARLHPAPASAEAAWRPAGEGLELRVRATPRGVRDAIGGLQTLADGRRVLKLRVRAAPENGAANQAVRRLLAAVLACPAKAVRLAAGAAARTKTFAIQGDPVTLAGALEAVAGKPEP